ncbi:MAG: hypothetical protein MMC33_009804, partial [Icmadophila ericetorum]|nr:hypothetical protein [Icmadophila ericetorum]
LRLSWPGNSPDLNIIEPTWSWTKRETTCRGEPQNRIIATKIWTIAWKKLGQKRIQEWIERIPRQIQQVIALNGGNEYREGREDGLVRHYNSRERRAAYAKQLAGYANTEDSRDATMVEDPAEEEEEIIWIDKDDDLDGTLIVIHLDLTHLNSNGDENGGDKGNDSENSNLYDNSSPMHPPSTPHSGLSIERLTPGFGRTLNFMEPVL